MNAEQDAVHADLAQLLRVLGLGDHARPYSPHEVMLDAINAVGELRSRLEVAERTAEWIAVQARTAERDRIIALAREKQATYWVGPDDSLAPRRPFALLLRDEAWEAAAKAVTP
jgi:hypothetical protein